MNRVELDPAAEPIKFTELAHAAQNDRYEVHKIYLKVDLGDGSYLRYALMSMKPSEKKYLDIRRIEVREDGSEVPTPKGVAVRDTQIGEVIEKALMEAHKDLLGKRFIKRRPKKTSEVSNMQEREGPS